MKKISGCTARLEVAEAERQQLQEELDESNDRVAYLENCMEKTESLEEQLAETLQALHEVHYVLHLSHASAVQAQKKLPT